MWLALTALGTIAAELLSRRVKAIDSVLLLLKRIELEVRQFSSPFPQLMNKIANEEKESGIAGDCVRRLNDGESFPEAWENGIKNSRLPFKKEERIMLSRLGKSLSACDREGVFQVLGICSDRFEIFLSEAKQTKEKYSKLCLFSGVFVGGMIFISIS